jgi:hypothetical protein
MACSLNGVDAAYGLGGYKLGGGHVGWVNTTDFAAAKSSTTATALPTSTGLTVASNNIASDATCNGASWSTVAKTCTLDS